MFIILNCYIMLLFYWYYACMLFQKYASVMGSPYTPNSAANQSAVIIGGSLGAVAFIVIIAIIIVIALLIITARKTRRDKTM